MNIERDHKGGGFVRIAFDEFFSEMPSTDCRHMLNLLIRDYDFSPDEIDEKFRIALSIVRGGRRRTHLLNSYKIFRREYYDGTIQGICAYEE